MKKPMDTLSALVVVITFVLFAIALFTTGFTHDLLLEAGVFLVSMKLIISSYKQSAFAGAVRAKLEEISGQLQRIETGASKLRDRL